MKKHFYIYGLMLSLLAIACSDKTESIVKRTTIAMGTSVEIQIAELDEKEAEDAITVAFNEVKRIDTLLSTYIEGHNMWRINNSMEEKIIVNTEIFQLLKKVDEYYNLTGGSFDPAIGKLIDLIGFENGNPNLPAANEVLSALENVGWKKIKLLDPDTLIKPVGIKINFGAIGQGYATDRASMILEQMGIKKYLVNVSGEIFGRGKDWKIGIQHPRQRGQLLGKIIADGKAIATSGDYEQFFNKNGKRYSHIINPVTGLPANEIEAVTVITNDATSADALSTGIFVLGVKKGIELIEQLPDVEGIIVDSTGTIHQSSGFGNYFQR
ncbi:MAG: FAD:protein FMN transferase [bacterium]